MKVEADIAKYFFGQRPAPAVAIRSGGEAWQIYYIHRDYLGSIVAVSNASGVAVETRSYDAWGRLRHPSTLQPYAHNAQPALFLRRGYTGHEHLPEFGLINMNARLYDPVIGRFLSPDPYVQAPEFSQSFNRYSYALNNPLIYTDPDGEFWFLIAGALIGAYFGGKSANDSWNPTKWDYNAKTWASMGVGALSGALGAGVGTGVTASLSGASFWGGFIGTQSAMTSIASGFTTSFINGALVGGASGFTSGFVSGFGNSLIAGDNFGSALGNGFSSGFFGGAGGALVGGMAGGIASKIDGRRFWDGATVEKNVLAYDPSIGNSIQEGLNDCVPNTGANAWNSTTGDNMATEQARYLMAPGTTKDDPLNMYEAMSNFANKLGRQSDGGEMLFEAAAMRMNAGHKAILNVNPNSPIGHVVNIRKITQILVTKPGSTYPIASYKINGMSGAGFQNYKFSTLKGFFVFLF